MLSTADPTLATSGTDFPPVIEGLKVQHRLGSRVSSAIWTVGEVHGDWTTILEWERTPGRKPFSRTPFFVPDFWKSFVPARWANFC